MRGNGAGSGIRQYRFVLWELTKRELKRKYARSYLGIMWSSVYPLLRMALVVFLFSTVFNKGIEKYPAYYFVGFLIFEFFAAATETSLTTLRDNRDLIIKSKLPRELFVLSRVLTSFVNFLLGCIPFLLVLAWYRAKITWHILAVPVILLLLVVFTTGVSYMLSIWFVFVRDAKNIYSNFVYILRFFVAMFYSVEGLSDGVRYVIEHNPLYAFIKAVRDCVVYGNAVESLYIWEIILWSIGAYLTGRILFKKYENNVVERL
jgi:ABC-2 type transport system permease protein/lipopolysaccharide transport system permease protein